MHVCIKPYSAVGHIELMLEFSEFLEILLLRYQACCVWASEFLEKRADGHLGDGNLGRKEAHPSMAPWVDFQKTQQHGGLVNCIVQSAQACSVP